MCAASEVRIFERNVTRVIYSAGITGSIRVSRCKQNFPILLVAIRGAGKQYPGSAAGILVRRSARSVWYLCAPIARHAAQSPLCRLNPRSGLGCAPRASLEQANDRHSRASADRAANAERQKRAPWDAATSRAHHQLLEPGRPCLPQLQERTGRRPYPRQMRSSMSMCQAQACADAGYRVDTGYPSRFNTRSCCLTSSCYNRCALQRCEELGGGMTRGFAQIFGCTSISGLESNSTRWRSTCEAFTSRQVARLGGQGSKCGLLAARNMPQDPTKECV